MGTGGGYWIIGLFFIFLSFFLSCDYKKVSADEQEESE